jgi:hypothetical protein
MQLKLYAILGLMARSDNPVLVELQFLIDVCYKRFY